MACTCGCSTPQTPAVPPSSQTDEHRIDLERTVANHVKIPVERQEFCPDGAEEPASSTLLCATRRRAILCCWIT